MFISPSFISPWFCTFYPLNASQSWLFQKRKEPLSQGQEQKLLLFISRWLLRTHISACWRSRQWCPLVEWTGPVPASSGSLLCVFLPGTHPLHTETYNCQAHLWVCSCVHLHLVHTPLRTTFSYQTQLQACSCVHLHLVHTPLHTTFSYQTQLQACSCMYLHHTPLRTTTFS